MAEIQSKQAASSSTTFVSNSIFVCKRISYLLVFVSARSQKFKCNVRIHDYGSVRPIHTLMGLAIGSYHEPTADADYRSRFADSLLFSLALHLRTLLFESQAFRSCLEEFRDLRFSSTDVADNWDGMLPLKTTSKCNNSMDIVGISDTEIHNYQINLKGSGSSRITRLSPNIKNGEKIRHAMVVKFVCLLLLALISYWLIFIPFYRREQRKVGSGEACCADNRLRTELVMEAVIVISNISMQNTTCFREYDNKTEVLYFKDFSPCTISQSSVKALQSIDWKTYGLNLGGVVEQDGVTLLQWENLPTDTHIDILLHSYHKQYPALDRSFLSLSETIKCILNLVKRAVKLSLDDLKANHSQAFLSSRDVEICGYAPDLARQLLGSCLPGECISLLGLQSQGVGTEIVENCIEERIVSVVEMDNKKPHNSQEPAPFLFEEDPVEELEFQENDFSPLNSLLF
ncbi:Type 2 DNA topoisomerase 6 subunit B-like [Glycine max]|nr:Type 2 DNA topoisomerase 6 subunit B-like [Glycine max]